MPATEKQNIDFKQTEKYKSGKTQIPINFSFIYLF